MKNREMVTLITDEKYCGDGQLLCGVIFENTSKPTVYYWDGFGASRDPKIGDEVLVNGLSHIGEIGRVVFLKAGYASDCSTHFEIKKIL